MNALPSQQYIGLVALNPGHYPRLKNRIATDPNINLGNMRRKQDRAQEEEDKSPLDGEKRTPKTPS